MNGDVLDSQHRQDPQQRELLRVCRIGRAQGLRGEVNVYSFTDEPERRFAPGSQLYAYATNQTDKNGVRAETDDTTTPYTVESSRFQKNRWVLKLQGVDDRTAAEALNGVELYAESDDADEMAEEDAWYPKDLIGLTATMAEDNLLRQPAGKTIGTIVDVVDTGAQWLLKIRLADSLSDLAEADKKTADTVLVPFVDEIVPDIDLDAGTLTLNPPGGLIPGM